MTDDDVTATANGILQCLRMLSEEAASLSLTRTFAAVQDAIAACQKEAGTGSAGQRSDISLSLLH